MHVYLGLLGCRLNEAEIERWRHQFESAGCTLSASAEQADLIVFNSCAVTAEAVRKTRQSINKLRRLNPSAKIVVSGCAVSLPKESGYQPAQTEGTAQHPSCSVVDLVLANTEKEALVKTTLNTLFPDFTGDLNDDIKTDNSLAFSNTQHRYPVITLQPENAGNAINPEAGTAENVAASNRPRQRAFLKIQDGCRYKCTYCIVTQARGEERSKSIHDLVDEVRSLENSGVQEVVLTGVHVGGYGSDTGESLTTLVRALLDDTSIARIRFASVEPWDLEPELLELFVNQRLMPHMHLPLQSGADSVLKRMARRCRTADFRTLVQSLRDNYKDFNVTTDIIVGFPGETDDEWHETLAFAEEMEFGHIHVFPFSARTGTHAARLSSQVNPALKKARAEQLRELARTSRRRYLSQYIGQTVDVLWESAKQIPDHKPGSNGVTQRFHGYTPNFLRVCADQSELNSGLGTGELMSLQNRLLPARISGLLNDNPTDQQSVLSATIDLN